MRSALLILLAITVGVALGVIADAAFSALFAQTVTPNVGTILLTSPGWKLALADFMMQIVQIAAPVLLAWFSWKLNEWFGLKKDATLREGFQVAVENGAGKMIQAATSAGQAVLIGSIGRNKALAEGLAYLKAAAPDAIKHFNLDDGALIEKLEAKVGLKLAEQPATGQ